MHHDQVHRVIIDIKATSVSAPKITNSSGFDKFVQVNSEFVLLMQRFAARWHRVSWDGDPLRYRWSHLKLTTFPHS